MTQPDIRKLAKQGNPQALAIILNQSLQSQNITAKVNLKDDCLQIMLESPETPNQQSMVAFIRKGLIKLEIESVKTVKLYGRQTGEKSPAWSQKLELLSPPETSPTTEPTATQNLSDYQTFRVPTRSVPPEEETTSSSRKTNFQNPQVSSAMSPNPNPSPSIGPVSIGNIISAAVRIYRDHFKLYFGLAFTGYLWVLVPIYGWAKSSAISALISRLAYSEVIERPETVDEARRHVMPRMWSFLVAGILVNMIYLGITIGAIFVMALLGGVIGVIGQNNLAVAFIAGLLLSIGFIISLIAYIRFIFRLYIVEMPLAIEENMTSTSTISRSLELTKGFAAHLQWIIFVGILVTIPISIVVQIAGTIIQISLTALFPKDSGVFWLLYYLLILLLSFASGSLVIPFWQAIKAVIYYDLRSRKEGLGLQIRDSH